MGAYSDEIDEIGYPVGAPLKYSITILISLIIFYFVWKLLPIKIRNAEIHFEYQKLFFSFFTIGLLYFSIPVFMYGPAPITGLNRYQFNDLPMVPLFNIKLFLGLLCSILGVIFATAINHKDKKLAFRLFLILMLINICYGEKASGLIIALIYFAIGYLIALNKKISIIKFSLSSLALLCFLISLYVGQLLIRDIELEGIWDHFGNRVARQSQLWWKVSQLSQSGAIAELDSGFKLFTEYKDVKSVDLEGGMRFMMSQVMEEKAFAKHKGSLAAGYPSILMFIDGGKSFWPLIVIMAFIYILPYYFCFFIGYLHPLIKLFVPFSLYFIGVHLKIFETGNIYLFSNPKYYFGYLFILLMLVIVLVQFKAFNTNKNK
ncbi:MAG: hypothetical protein KDD58_03595 [Bdellovibrionales bacterium]|nr:hypothetical protein [Bdellovibrionales bacterium]